MFESVLLDNYASGYILDKEACVLNKFTAPHWILVRRISWEGLPHSVDHTDSNNLPPPPITVERLSLFKNPELVLRYINCLPVVLFLSSNIEDVNAWFMKQQLARNDEKLRIYNLYAGAGYVYPRCMVSPYLIYKLGTGIPSVLNDMAPLLYKADLITMQALIQLAESNGHRVLTQLDAPVGWSVTILPTNIAHPDPFIWAMTISNPQFIYSWGTVEPISLPPTFIIHLSKVQPPWKRRRISIARLISKLEDICECTLYPALRDSHPEVAHEIRDTSTRVILEVPAERFLVFYPRLITWLVMDTLKCSPSELPRL